MVRRPSSSRVVASALMFAASALTLSRADLEYQIRVRNLTYQQPFSGVVFIAHTKEFSIFKEGLKADYGLRDLAEFGDTLFIWERTQISRLAPYLCGSVIGDYNDRQLPGETARYTLTVDEDICGDGGEYYISMATMLVNTNDGFVGFDSETLRTRGSSKIFPPVWDAGTEDNNELCTHITGEACDAFPGNEEVGSGEGYVHVHRGIHGVGDLPAADYTWLNPAAEVYISKPVSV